MDREFVESEAQDDGSNRPAEVRTRLQHVLETMREMSLQTDPQKMVGAYVRRMQSMMPMDARLGLSRRGLVNPQVRITRFSGWNEDINPWMDQSRLPIVAGGLLADLIYSDEPQIISDLRISSDDPAAEFLGEMRSLLAIPLFDEGVSLNMVVLLRREPDAFRLDELPERVWMANLFGRATSNLVLAEQRDAAYRMVDDELRVVADIQRSLLPTSLPTIPGMELAAHYQTSQRAGGDYYDFFALPEGRWGLLIADVSGHGTPAAVVMAVTHCIAHTLPGAPTPPGVLLEHLNHHLTRRYTRDSGRFVTAFYAEFDPATRRLKYASAGHNPPRLRHCGQPEVLSLDEANTLPLGIAPDWTFPVRTVDLLPGDRLVLYTDGIVEAGNGHGQMFGTERLDAILQDCTGTATQTRDRILREIHDFTEGLPPADDRTLLVIDVS
ncbi:PP2C family protein-serine/threonine phosphatase [Planctellipticum variicoloris]|uniref:PP2C family protein-serine/threonine phosphatase n=1 Tax=Planctellipticum variicoloris TaxID=3064265 RepID=UPI002C400725|nr:PP2C family protein-serine/threonine phosphatase [Planctomycetaceae bacterium SH412]HTN00887.1 PP2C family protein-serine/threonine phosphatase [Planctomycetaceae bacterium]